MKVGVLTGGGDAPGLNMAIRGIVYAATKEGMEVVGIEYGWKGLLEGITRPLTIDDVADLWKEGGTILFSSRTNPAKDEATLQKAFDGFKKLGLDALIAIGGEDTLGAAWKLYQKGLPTVGVPKTIDHDLSATHYTIGFDTAINRVAEFLEYIHTTAKSHNRVIVVEIMGRHAGWMTLMGGLAGGAHYIVIPEVPLDLDDLINVIKKRYEQGKKYAVIAVAEGTVFGESSRDTEIIDEFGHVKVGGVAEAIAKIIKEKTDFEVRHVVPGHLQRGGEPTATDRWVPLRMGVLAVELVKKKEFGKMISVQGEEFTVKSLEEGVGKLRTVPPELYEFAKLFFG